MIEHVEPRLAAYYRTAAGAEMDLILELPQAGLVAIEIKRSRTFTLERGFHHARSDLAPTHTYVVHGGDERYSLRDGVEAIGLVDLLTELANLG